MRSTRGTTWAVAAISCAAFSCAGTDGKDGAPGAQGPTGAAGANGQNGIDGEDGVNGATGATGPTGIAGATGATGATGANGATGATGANGSNGSNGTNGTNGTNGRNGTVLITDRHGVDYLHSSGEYATGKFIATATITAATADASGRVTVSFRIGKGNTPLPGLRGMSFTIAKLLPPNAVGSTHWVSYLYARAVVSGSAAGDWPNPDGTEANQATRESNGTLTDLGNGTYTYVFATNLSNVRKPVGNVAVPYERNRTHRISMMVGGHSGATAETHFDFVPDGSPVTLKREIVQTEACVACHGSDFAGHGGDRLTVENCVTCHVADTFDPQGGESLDFPTMIHKIHSGAELERIPGADGIVWDNPATPVDESLDNGEYAIWGYRNAKHTWWKAEFPAIVENCTKCHQGDGAQVNNWKTVPTRAACGSCHESVDFATGVNHPAGAQPNDDNCTVCHLASGDIAPPAFYPIPAAHDWTKKDPRNIPEFGVELTVSRPANGRYFVRGEAPVVTLVLKENGTPIDHTTVVQDPTAEGCARTGCPTRDGLFTNAALFVHGPRGRRNPVLTTMARVRVVSSTTGPFNLSAAGANLVLTVDGGEAIKRVTPRGQDIVYSGNITVTVPATGTFANRARATPQEVVSWLNGNAAFAARAIAYLDNGRPAIRSRNLGQFFALQLGASAVTTAVFGGDVTPKTVGGTYPANQLYRATVAANSDPKAVRTAGSITYQLDPVDDLAPGTYVASVEIADRGRIDGVNYRTPSVGKVTFQVGQANEEPSPALNCDRCHWGPDNRGFVLDFPRHNKMFDHQAVDQCGACHDYQNRDAVGAWAGAGAIARRVHAVHFGSELNYPLTTVGYSNGDPVAGRFWDIKFPMNIRECQSCHPDGESSGSWATEAARLPCGGCHDSDAASAHMKLMTFDPTPANPWSGDEEESCKVCH